MGFSTATLYGYYVKCGAPEYEAQVVASTFGDKYTELNNVYRSRGSGDKSKAFAALHLSEIPFLDALSLVCPIWDNAKSHTDVLVIIDTEKSLGVCIVAVAAYALQENRSAYVTQKFSEFLRCAQTVSALYGKPIESQEHLAAIRDITMQTAARALALGQQKGFFSRIFG